MIPQHISVRLALVRRVYVATQLGLLAVLVAVPWGLVAADAADAGKPPAPAKETADSETPKNALMRGLSEALKSNADDLKDAKDDLKEMLLEADAAFTEMKRANRDALRSLRTTPFSTQNIVLIVADDIGFGDLGCYGQERVRTPHIDNLAQHGIRFATFYAGGATDAASRWTLMAGTDTAAARQGGQSSYELVRGRAALGEMMRRAGYDTVFVGNWPLGGNPEGDPVSEFRGFDQWLGHLMGTKGENRHFPEAVWSNGRRIPLKANADGKTGQLAQEFYVEHVVNYLKKWGERQRRPPQTFHPKLHNYDLRHPFFLVVVLSVTADSRQALPALAASLDTGLPEADRGYAAAVSRLDSDVGKIVQEVDRQGLTHSTTVFLVGENGPSCEPATGDRLKSTRGLRGQKGALYEGGIRVPLIVRWPGHVPAGEVCYYHAAMWDLAPTCAEIAGRPLGDRACDGLSLFSILRGNAETKPRMLYWEDHEGGLSQAVRKGPWKVVRPAGKMRLEDVELYNLQDDPVEAKNVATQHPEIVKQFLKP